MISQAPIPTFNFRQRISLLKIRLWKWEIPTYTTSEELLELLYLARQLEDGAVAVEIGAYIGASSLMIAKGLKSGSKLICVDTWANDAMTEGNWDTFKVFQSNTASVSDRIKPVRITSVEASANISGPIDFLFVDGDHSYEGVKADIDAWFGKLRPGGIIVMHDVGWAESVQRVIKENVQPALSSHRSLPNMYWGWKR